MNRALRIGLRAGERIYINGAVLRVDRKVRLELLNDVTFLLESHVMQPEDATTPLRQLYFLVQGLLINPTDPLAQSLPTAIAAAIDVMCTLEKDPHLISELRGTAHLIATGRVFDGLKVVRSLMQASENARSPDSSEPKRTEAA